MGLIFYLGLTRGYASPNVGNRLLYANQTISEGERLLPAVIYR